MLQLPIRTYLLIEIEYKVKVFLYTVLCWDKSGDFITLDIGYPAGNPEFVSGYPAWSGSGENFPYGTTLVVMEVN